MVFMKNKDILIRQIEETEIAEAIQCIHSASEANKQDYPPEFIEQLNTQNYTVNWLLNVIKNRDFYVLVNSGIICATGSHIKNKIVNIFVHLDCQNQGFGTAMMNFLEKKLVGYGYLEASLNANMTSKGFYQHLGYRVIEDREETINGHQIISLTMMKKF